jgi:hypothetical protein
MLNIIISKNSIKYSIITSSITYVILSKTLDTTGKIVFNGLFVVTYLGGSTISYLTGNNICSKLMQNIYLINIFVKPKINITKTYLTIIPSIIIGGITMLLVSSSEFSYYYLKKIINKYKDRKLELIADDYEIVEEDDCKL